jgi:hypothetical protein
MNTMLRSEVSLQFNKSTRNNTVLDPDEIPSKGEAIVIPMLIPAPDPNALTAIVPSHPKNYSMPMSNKSFE